MDACWPAARRTEPQDNGGDINICIVSVERPAARQWLTCGSLFICSRGASAARSLNASPKLYLSTQTGALARPAALIPPAVRVCQPRCCSSSISRRHGGAARPVCWWCGFRLAVTSEDSRNLLLTELRGGGRPPAADSRPAAAGTCDTWSVRWGGRTQDCYFNKD